MRTCMIDFLLFTVWMIVLAVAFILLMQFASAGDSRRYVSAECNGSYVPHDHYKNNYRIRHKHCVASLAEHYRVDPLRSQRFHLPEEPEPIPEPEKETEPEKKTEPKITIELQIVPPESMERDETIYRPII